MRLTLAKARAKDNALVCRSMVKTGMLATRAHGNRQNAPQGRPSSLEITCAGHKWQLKRPAALEDLWRGLGTLDEDHIPYWVELWPASVLLGDWLLENSSAITGRRCIDLGCGLGLTAMIGQWLGANVAALDYELEAVRFARRNACHNGLRKICGAVADWRHPPIKNSVAACVWAADIVYEKRHMGAILEFLRFVPAPGGRAWLAEPGRTIFASFITLARKSGWHCRCRRKRAIATPYARAGAIPVSIWELIPCVTQKR